MFSLFFLDNNWQENLRSEYLQLFENLSARIQGLENENTELFNLSQNLQNKLDHLISYLNDLNHKVDSLIADNFK